MVTFAVIVSGGRETPGMIGACTVGVSCGSTMPSGTVAKIGSFLIVVSTLAVVRRMVVNAGAVGTAEDEASAAQVVQQDIVE